MKKILSILSVLLLIGFVGYSQQIATEKVPAAVTEAFAEKFPGVTYVAYQMEMDDYSVAFKDKGVGKSATFNSKGEWLETETVILESDLPKDVLTSVATNFVGYMITNIVKTDGPGDVLNYEMDVKKDKVGYEVKFSPDGNILKKTPLKN